MKKEYVKPTMTIEDCEPVQMIATSLGFGETDVKPDGEGELPDANQGKDRGDSNWGNLW